MKATPYKEYAPSGITIVNLLPAEWTISKISRIARRGYRTFIDGDWIESPYITLSGIRLLQTGNVGIGVYKDQGFRYISEDTFQLLGCTEVHPGDVLICRLADPVGRACIAPTLDVKMITSVDVCILKASHEWDTRYVTYFLSSKPYLDFMDAVSRGGTRDRISRSFLGNVKIPKPDVMEQKSISDFLDRETAQADALVAKYERFIDVLEEKRTALITQGVTKGVDPDVPMKDSAIEWIGEIPENWAVSTLARAVTDMCDGPFGSSMKSSHYADTGVQVIRLQNIGKGHFIDLSRVFIAEEYFKYLKGHDARPGDLIIAGLGDANNFLGRACLVPSDINIAMVKADCFRLRLDNHQLLNEYVMHYLNSNVARAEVANVSKGATRDRMNLGGVAKIRLPIPPIAVQEAIIAQIGEANAAINSLRKKIGIAVSLVLERRSALITSAVTGQIDVQRYDAAKTVHNG